MRRPLLALLAVLAAVAAGASGCASGTAAPSAGAATGPAPAAPPRTTTTVQVIRSVPGARFDAAAIYRNDAPSVVTVISVYRGRGGGGLLGGGAQAGQGSGFVVSPDGEVVTNAHVITDGQSPNIRRADQVFVKFADGNEVGARVVGYDPNADVGLLRIDPRGLSLRPLELASSAGVTVGAPVAAIGSPFGEAQSLSVGVVSATQRSIDSLTGFQISGALQTDAAINHGNSGGPLLDAGGRVLGINSQIKSSSGGGEGVGFAVPVDLVKRSLAQLRGGGRVRYPYLGVETTQVYPQLAQRFNLPVQRGAWVQKVVPGGPAATAGVRAGGGQPVLFQAAPYRTGGDVIVGVGQQPVRSADDLGRLLMPFQPGQEVELRLFRDGKQQTVRVRLAERPKNAGP